MDLTDFDMGARWTNMSDFKQTMEGAKLETVIIYWFSINHCPLNASRQWQAS